MAWFFSIILSDSPAHIFAVQNHLPITKSTARYFWITRPENRKFYPEKKLFKKGLCPITTGYGQNETLSCLIDYDSEWDFVLLDWLWSAEIRARQGLALWVLCSLDAPWSCRYDTDKQTKPLCGPDPEPLPTHFRTCLLFMELNRHTQVQKLRRISDRMRLSRNMG